MNARQTINLSLLIGCLVGISGVTSRGQEFDERYSDWPQELKIDGTVVVCAEAESLSATGQLLNDESRVLLVADVADPAKLLEQYQSRVTQVNLASIAELEGKLEFPQYNTLAWHSSSAQVDQATTELLGRLCSKWLDQGRTLILAGRHADRAGHSRIGGGVAPTAPAEAKNIQANPNNGTADFSIEPGWNLLPECVIQLDGAAPNPQTPDSTELPTTESTNAGEAHRELLPALRQLKSVVGIRLESETALRLRGRKVRVAGSGGATFVLRESQHLPQRQARIVARTGRRQPVRQWWLDLTGWRRDAIERTLDQFPPQHPKTPLVPDGTLFIVGGGGLPDGLMEDFVEAAGGVEHARLVYVPCAEDEQVSESQATVRLWTRMGVRHASFIHTKDRQTANEDDSFLAPLRDATGIWFGGGRQWNFADSYYGTTAHRLMKEVLHRGGAIGGSSAGASIQARYLARATPIENFRIMAPGYERGGLGFLSGVAIDQHFSQRRRQADMTKLVDRYPQLLGIGIDESTAIVVRKSLAEVVGDGQVFFYDRTRPVFPNRPDYVAVDAGNTFDLANRQLKL